MGRQRRGRVTTRNVYRGWSEAEEARMGRKLGIAQQPTEPEKTPGIDVATTKARKAARRLVAQETLVIIEQSPGRVLAHRNTPRGVIERTPRAVQVWGDGWATPEGQDRVQLATERALQTEELRRDDLRFYTSKVRHAARWALEAGCREVLGSNSVMSAFGLFEALNYNPASQEAAVANEQFGTLKPGDFREQARIAFGARTTDLADGTVNKMSAVFDRVVDVWVSPNAATRADGMRRTLPADDYRREIDGIDWQVMVAEKERRGTLPPNTEAIVTAAMRDACNELNVDYATWNGIQARQEHGLQPVAVRDEFVW